MKSKIVRVGAMSAAGALLAACHGFYGGGDVGVGYVGPAAPAEAAAAATSSTARSTAAASDVSAAGRP